MLNKLNYFRKLSLAACLIFGLVLIAVPANAQFIGINADVAIAYSAAPGSVSGGYVGISHPAPFFPNIGFSSISFSEKEDKTDASDNTSVSLNTNTTIKTIILFYNVPFPVVTISVGFGYGSQNLNTGMETKTTIVETYEGTKIDPDNSDLKTSVSEAFMQIGLPFWNTIEFHLGYHHMSVTSIDITSKKSTNFRGTYTIEKKNYSGGMTTIGVQVAF